MMKVLGRTISKAKQNSKIKGLKVSFSIPLVSHSHFVDDPFSLGEEKYEGSWEFQQ